MLKSCWPAIGFVLVLAGCTAVPPKPATLPAPTAFCADDLKIFRQEDQRQPVVMIDPGHGGGDSGARGRCSVEKDLNLKLALFLGQELSRRGFRVLYTRNDDHFETLAARPLRGNLARADLFISIHHNASLNRDRSGCECFALTPEGCHSSDGTPDPGGVRAGNRQDRQNLQLASLCQKHLVRAAEWQDRGVKFARFRVLCDAACPAVLVEAGFVSNRREEKMIVQKAHQRKVALALADAVAEYRALERVTATGSGADWRRKIYPDSDRCRPDGR